MVEIPADVAKAIADLRRITAPSNDEARLSRKAWADILWPQPPTLREQVAKAWCADYYGEYSSSAKNPRPDQLDAADAVLAVVAEAPIEWVLATFGARLSDWLEAQPRTPLYAIDLRHAERNQRDHDVRLLREGA